MPPTPTPDDRTPVRDTADEPVSVPAQPEAHHFSCGYSVHASAAPLAGSGRASGPPSGQQIRNLRDWIEENRDGLDLGPYQLVRVLGTGSYGTVWEAKDRNTGEPFAIKFLAEDDQAWALMLKEVRALGAVHKDQAVPGIVSVHYVSRGSATQPPYYVMTLAGGSLGDRLKQLKRDRAPGGGPLVPVADAVRLFTSVVTALAAVHRRGIHHCDLKPPNVLLEGGGAGALGNPLIADFGQAHLANDDTPALGTFFYMPPDQADAAVRKAPPNGSWDVYGVAAIFYEMLTGDPPRSAPDLLAELRATEHLDTKLALYRDRMRGAPAPTAHRALVDAPLARLIDRCLDPDPAKRPRDAGEVEDALRRRAWWRQTRRPLAIGTAAGIWFVLFVMLVSTEVAVSFHNAAKEQARKEIDGSLVPTAVYGARIVERELNQRVRFVERHAENCRCREELVAAARAVGAGQGTAPRKALAELPRDPFDTWIAAVAADASTHWYTENAVASVLVTKDQHEGNHGFTLSAVRRGLSPRQVRQEAAEITYRDWAFRDYFHGTGNRFEHEEKEPGKLGKAFPVIRNTHISRAYKSRGEGQPWLVDVATPVWSEPGRKGEVVALLAVALPIESLKGAIGIDEQKLPKESTVVKHSSAYVLNDRKCWVWHKEGSELIANKDNEDPHDLDALARARAGADGRHPADYRPWPAADDPVRHDATSGATADEKRVYYDPLRRALWEHTGGSEPGRQIVHLEPFRPYGGSGYDESRDREWSFVVQIDEATALEPIRELKLNIFWTGSALVLTLVALVVALWVWLVRVLRNWEFVAHG